MIKQIIPAILTSDVAELRFKLESVSGLVEWVQVDIMDNDFVPNTSVAVSDLKDIAHQSKVSVHLMVKQPQRYIDDCQAAGVTSVIFHYETTDDHQQVLDQITKAGMEAGIALSPETNVVVVQPFLKQLKSVVLLGVTPGFSGQRFIPETLDHIKELRKLAPDLFITVDGGITLENIAGISNAGANGFVVSNAIFKNNDVKKVIEELKKKVN